MYEEWVEKFRHGITLPPDPSGRSFTLRPDHAEWRDGVYLTFGSKTLLVVLSDSFPGTQELEDMRGHFPIPDTDAAILVVWRDDAVQDMAWLYSSRFDVAKTSPLRTKKILEDKSPEKKCGFDAPKNMNELSLLAKNILGDEAGTNWLQNPILRLGNRSPLESDNIDECFQILMKHPNAFKANLSS